jgi:hypothetical protein
VFRVAVEVQKVVIYLEILLHQGIQQKAKLKQWLPKRERLMIRTIGT